VAREGAFFGKFYSWLKCNREKSRKTDAFVKETRDFRQKTCVFRAYTLWVVGAASGRMSVAALPVGGTGETFFPLKQGLAMAIRSQLRRFT